MSKGKLKTFIGTGEFEIIDDWNHQYIETLPRDEAIAKYGECEVCGSYTEASSQIPDDNGKIPSWKTAVWVEIPGMKVGYWNSTNLHLRFCGDQEEATFIGKKSGQLITIHCYDSDDYSAWLRDASEKDNETAGCSVRGSAMDIIAEIYDEWFDDPKTLEHYRKKIEEKKNKWRWLYK